MLGAEGMQPVRDNDRPTSCTESVPTVTPKLRKNKRIETRWGQKYCATLREAVFMRRPTPYAPARPPPPIRDKVDDTRPVYTCKQCGDRFHFASSLEVHNLRRSWILGYWCQNCFFTDCSHMQSGQPPCFDCQTINRQRKTYLRAKGLRKGRKMGCIKIFYNQCQFYAHLNDHRTNIVDMADIMLMPIPLDVKRERYADLERLCETLLEHMFLTRTHVMDWLKSKHFGDKWWNLLQPSSEHDEDPLTAILKSTELARGGKKTEKHSVTPPKRTSTDAALPSTTSPGSSTVVHPTARDSSSSISETIEAVIAQSAGGSNTEPSTDTEDSETSPSPAETPLGSPRTMGTSDDSRTTADIAFVDCGSAAKAYASRPANSLPRKHKTKRMSSDGTGRSRIVNLSATKAVSRLLSKISGNPLKINQTDNLASAKPPSTAPAVNRGSFEPKITVKKFAFEHPRDPPSDNNQNNSSKLNNRTPQVTKKLPAAPNVKLTGARTLLAPATDGTTLVEKAQLKKTVTQTSLSNLGSRILTVHGSKNTDLSQIIEQLPPDVISGKKIVFIGQNPERISLLSKSESAANLGMIKIPSGTEKTKIVQTLPDEAAPPPASHTAGEQGAKVSPRPANKNISIDRARPKIQQICLDGRIIYQNGKKFVIRHTRKTNPGPAPNNSGNLKLQTVPKRVTLSSFLSKPRVPVNSHIPIAAKPVEMGADKSPPSLAPFAPKPTSPSSATSSLSLSPPLSAAEFPRGSKFEGQPNGNRANSSISEKSSGSASLPGTRVLASSSLAALLLRNVHKFDAVEYFSIDQHVAGWVYIDFSKGRAKPTDANRGLGWSEILVKYKQQVSDNILYHGEKRGKQLVEHLKEVNSEYSKMIGVTDDARIAVNSEAINELERISNESSLKSDRGPTPSDDDIEEILLGFRDTTEATVCSVCNKPARSKSHIAISPETPATDLDRCRCNDYICHICNVFQGNMSRLISHLNFHAKREPFSCPECLKKFPTFLKLETHVWTACFHLLARRWFKCRICRVEGFSDVESLTRHFVIAHSKVKLACPLCGILLGSRTAFGKHCERAHPTTRNSVPVELSECEVGKYFVRLDQYKSHLDEHVAVIKMLYYKCPFCSFLVRETDRGRELIKHHLHHCHCERLSELVSPASLPAVTLSKNADKIKSRRRTERVDLIEVRSDDASECEGDDGAVLVSDRVTDLSKTNRRMTADVVGNNLQADDRSPVDPPNATLSEKVLENGIECSVWSINLEQSGSPRATDSARKPSEVVASAQKSAGNRRNVIAEYSLSPQIFDVRTVTPDSYAELEGTTEERVDVESGVRREALKSVSNLSKVQIPTALGEVKIFDRRSRTIVSKRESEDSVFVKLGGPSLPVKLPQVIVINRADRNVDLTEMFQSTAARSDTFTKSQDLNFNGNTAKDDTGINPVESAAASTGKKTGSSTTSESPVPAIKTVFALAPLPKPEGREKLAGVDADATEVSGSVEELARRSADGKEPARSVSVPRSGNNDALKMSNDSGAAGDPASDPRVDTPRESQVTAANTSARNEAEITGSSLRDIPKLPPLARIPRSTEASRPQVPLEENEEFQEVRPYESKSSAKLTQRRRRPWRIALNAPPGTSERIDYRCHLCGELIDTSWPVIRNHFRARHAEDYKLSTVTPRLLRVSGKFGTGGCADVSGSRKRKLEGNVPSSKRRKRWSPKKHVEKYPLDLGLCVEQASVQDREGKFICKKCDERCDDISTLRTHIGTNHRIKDHYLVCLECGENFVVEPSLQMHLKVFHSIKDPCDYLAQNTAYAKELIEIGESEPKTSIANQCHVCMAVFEDKSAVDKHFRVHGMAFLNRKRIEARIAARNPEKKLRIDKPDSGASLSPVETERTESHEVGETRPNDGVVS